MIAGLHVGVCRSVQPVNAGATTAVMDGTTVVQTSGEPPVTRYIVVVPEISLATKTNGMPSLVSQPLTNVRPSGPESVDPGPEPFIRGLMYELNVGALGEVTS